MIDKDLKLNSQLVMIPSSISDMGHAGTNKGNVFTYYHKLEEEG